MPRDAPPQATLAPGAKPGGSGKPAAGKPGGGGRGAPAPKPNPGAGAEHAERQQAASLRTQASGLRAQAANLDAQAAGLSSAAAGKPKKSTSTTRRPKKPGTAKKPGTRKPSKVSAARQQITALHQQAASLRHRAAALDTQAASVLAKTAALIKHDSSDPSRRHVATAIDELTYVSFPISKFEKTEDGDLIVVGKATDGSVDSDEQIVDPVWSAKALTEWIDTGGNLRVQHQAMRDPAGKGLGVQIDRDGDGGHWVRSLVVEPVAKRLVEKGVLTAYSVGIARPVITRDPTGKARGGIVTGGSFAELSLVDRPANKNCGLMIAKAAAGDRGDLELVGEVFGDAEFLAKASTEDELLTKAAGAEAGTAADGDSPDGAELRLDPAVKVADPDAIRDADDTTRLAYKAARQEWLGREPSVKGIAGGTEYLAQRAAWMRWDAEGDGEGLTGTREAAQLWLSKRDFSAAERDSAADSGAAMSDGSFPVKTAGDLDNAIHLAGHAKDPVAARAHIKRRAAALGLSDKIPDSWKTENAEATADVASLSKMITDGLVAVRDAQVMLGPDGWNEMGKAAAGDGTVGDTGSSFAGGKGRQCPTCKGDGKIKGGQVTCPDCDGKGTVPAAKADQDPEETAVAEPETVKGSKDCKGCGKNYDADAGISFCGNCGKKLPSASKGAGKAARKAEREAALLTLAGTVAKSVEAGLISQEAADEIIAEAAAAKARKRGLPGDVKPAGTHREPDGSSTVERLEPEAGMGTSPDATPDKVPASVGPKAAAPYSVARMHDMLCAAYDPAATMAEYPALKGIGDAVDEAWLSGLAGEAAAAGKAKRAARLAALVQDAQYVRSADPAALADGSAHLRKSFTDMYPNLHISPKDGIRPGSYQRPYLSAGHAAENAAHNGEPNIPDSSHVPAPEHFHRPLITDGHQADSPANKADGPGIAPVTGAARTYYTHAQRDKARTALAALHDHIATSFPDLCPMASSKSVMPPDLGRTNTPQPVTPPAEGGVATVGKAEAGTDADVLRQVVQESLERHAQRTGYLSVPEPVLTRRRLEKAASRMGLAVTELHPAATPAAVQLQPAGLTADQMKALLTEQLTPLAERYENQMDDLRKQVDEIGARPDPAMAPVRGALARVPDSTAVPVARRSLVDEAAENAAKNAAAQEAHYRAYVDALAKSPDPGVREAALATLDKLSAAPALTAAAS
jgi:hypothetical protein